MAPCRVLRSPAAFAAAAVALALHPVASAGVTPIQKVIELLEGMRAKGVAEKQAEEVRFSSFAQWCQDQSRIKQDEIDEGTSKIEMLSAKIEKATAHIDELTNRINELGEDVARWQKDAKSASEVREKEAADYRATAQDYAESIDAIDGALVTLKQRAQKIPQAEALLQVARRDLVPDEAKQAIAAYLQQPAVEAMPDEHLSYEAPEAYGYEFQSGGVVDILQKLKDEFAEKKHELDADELNAKHSYEKLAQQMADNIENAEHEIKKKTEARAQTQEVKAGLEGEKVQAVADLAEDQKYLDETKALCAQKTTDFNARQELRAGELQAIAQAIDIMSSDAVKGSGEKHLPSLLAARGASLVSLRRGTTSRQALVQQQAAAFLAERAKLWNSRILASASQKVAADPFEKVKRMIKDLISNLMQESTAEIEHKGWCDTELTTNKQTRDQKAEAVEELSAEKEAQTSLIAKLTQEIEDLAVAVAELDSAMAEAASDRAASKEKNTATITDAKAAQTAVENAIAVLKDFYAKSAQATALVQGPAEDAPETFDKPYTGMLPEGGSVVDFLEVILTDFTRLESETSAAEQAEQDEFDKFIFESQKDKALKENENGHKAAKKQDTENALVATEEELKLTQEQLDKAIAYYEKLKPTCVDSGITYEERVKRREEEMQSLQEALKILQGTDLS